jgi:hypothetical protein
MGTMISSKILKEEDKMSCKFIYVIKTTSTARQYQAMCMNVSLVLKHNRKCILYNSEDIFHTDNDIFRIVTKKPFCPQTDNDSTIA